MSLIGLINAVENRRNLTKTKNKENRRRLDSALSAVLSKVREMFPPVKSREIIGLFSSSIINLGARSWFALLGWSNNRKKEHNN